MSRENLAGILRHQRTEMRALREPPRSFNHLPISLLNQAHHKPDTKQPSFQNVTKVNEACFQEGPHLKCSTAKLHPSTRRLKPLPVTETEPEVSSSMQ